MKPKGILVLKKFHILCQKSKVESRYPELMYKRYCLHPPGHLVQRHLCILEARKKFLVEINLLRFHYTYWAPSILLRSKHYGIILLVKGSNNQFQMLNKNLTKFNIHFQHFCQNSLNVRWYRNGCCMQWTKNKIELWSFNKYS